MSCSAVLALNGEACRMRRYEWDGKRFRSKRTGRFRTYVPDIWCAACAHPRRELWDTEFLVER